MKITRFLLTFALIVLSSSCSYFTTDFSNLQTFDDNGNLQVVIENTKGDTSNLAYDFSKEKYVVLGDLQHPHPANKGFVPSTFNSNDINPLDAIVVSKPLTKGETLSVKPIAVLKYKIENIVQYDIVVVPILTNLLIDPIKNFEEFSLKNIELRQQISKWILQQHEHKNIQFLGWYDEDEALSIIKENQVRT